MTTILFFKIMHGNKLVKNLIFGFLSGFIISFIFILNANFKLEEYIYILVCYIIISIIFILFLAGFKTSIRFEVLRLLYDQYLNGTNNLKLYNNNTLLNRRLQRLLGAGTVEIRQSKYFVNSRILVVICNIFLFLRHIFS